MLSQTNENYSDYGQAVLRAKTRRLLFVFTGMKLETGFSKKVQCSSCYGLKKNL
jgi:hypothetical protein